MRVIDLEPHVYRSTVKGPAPERDKREPFWGPIARIRWRTTGTAN
jgi:hypothetical protein